MPTTWLIPSWAPDFHPLVIHFPIVLVMTAAVLDLVDVRVRTIGMAEGSNDDALRDRSTLADGRVYDRTAGGVHSPGARHGLSRDHRASPVGTRHDGVLRVGGDAASSRPAGRQRS